MKIGWLIGKSSFVIRNFRSNIRVSWDNQDTKGGNNNDLAREWRDFICIKIMYGGIKGEMEWTYSTQHLLKFIIMMVPTVAICIETVPGWITILKQIETDGLACIQEM